MANECIFHDDYILQVEDIAEYVNDRNEIKTSMKAKEYIISVINANSNKFGDNLYGECWGKIIPEHNGDETTYRFLFNAQILYRELEKGGFEFNTVKKDWADEGFLKPNSQGKYIHQTTINREKGSYIMLVLD